VVYEVQYNRFKPKRGVIEMCIQATDTIQYNGTKLHITGAYLPRKHNGYLSPLVFVLIERGISLGPVQANTGNYQGFTCGWEIVDDELYLIRFSSRSRRVYKSAQIFGMEPIDDISEESVQEIVKPKEEKSLREANREEEEENLTPEEKEIRTKALIAEILRKMDEPEVVPIPREYSPEEFEELKKELDATREKIREIERSYADDTTRMKAPWFTGNIIAYEWRAKDEQERNGWKFTFQEGMLVKKKRTYVWTPKRLKDYIED